MSLTDAESVSEVQEEFYNLDQQIVSDEKTERKKKIMSWLVSLGAHAVVMLLFGTIAFAVMEPETDAPVTAVTYILPPVTKPPETINRELIEIHNVTEEITETNEENTENVVSQLVVEDAIVASSDTEESETNMQKGRAEATSDSEMGGVSMMGNIGAGSNAAGMFGDRRGGGNTRARLKMGNRGKEADRATDAGLRFLKRHQSPNGMWSATNYFQNCTEGIKCEPGKDAGGNEDVAMCGYSLLAFLGAGSDHKTGKYKTVVKKGLDYLISIQTADGLLGERNYEHAIATMALAEAYGMTNDPALKTPAQKAVDVIKSRQAIENVNDPYSALLWDYVTSNPNRLDQSVTGWNIMALKSAMGAGLDVGNSMVGAKKSIERVWKAANPNWEKKTDPYKDTTIFPYTWNAVTNTTEKDHLSFVGATCAVFLGHTQGDIMLETLANDAIQRWITSGRYKQNSYSVYYLSAVLFQMGGDRWKLALDTLIPHSIETQRASNDCYDGSWDYTGQTWHGADTSRVLSTCYNILNLEIAYRYAQIHPEVKIKKK